MRRIGRKSWEVDDGIRGKSKMLKSQGLYTFTQEISLKAISYKGGGPIGPKEAHKILEMEFVLPVGLCSSSGASKSTYKSDDMKCDDLKYTQHINTSTRTVDINILLSSLNGRVDAKLVPQINTSLLSNSSTSQSKHIHNDNNNNNKDINNIVNEMMQNKKERWKEKERKRNNLQIHHKDKLDKQQQEKNKEGSYAMNEEGENDKDYIKERKKKKGREEKEEEKKERKEERKTDKKKIDKKETHTQETHTQETQEAQDTQNINHHHHHKDKKTSKKESPSYPTPNVLIPNPSTPPPNFPPKPPKLQRQLSPRSLSLYTYRQALSNKVSTS